MLCSPTGSKGNPPRMIPPCPRKEYGKPKTGPGGLKTRGKTFPNMCDLNNRHPIDTHFSAGEEIDIAEDTIPISASIEKKNGPTDHRKVSCDCAAYAMVGQSVVMDTTRHRIPATIFFIQPVSLVILYFYTQNRPKKQDGAFSFCDPNSMATPHKSARKLSERFCAGSKFQK